MSSVLSSSLTTLPLSSSALSPLSAHVLFLSPLLHRGNPESSTWTFDSWVGLTVCDANGQRLREFNRNQEGSKAPLLKSSVLLPASVVSVSIRRLTLQSLSLSQREPKNNRYKWLYQATFHTIKSLCCSCSSRTQTQKHITHKLE